MSIHLIIDGYNIIRQSRELAALDARDLQQGREALLEQLAAYRRAKRHPMTVVFDGWEAGDFSESRDRVQGIVVIYSRRGEKADEVIKRLVAREGSRAVVVSSDRELLDYAESRGGAGITAPDFELRLMLTMTGTEDGDESEDSAGGLSTKKKGPAHRASKKERRARQRTKKV